jgi:hypothetical protein
MRVTWELRLTSLSADVCRLDCNVVVETADGEPAARVAHLPAGTPNPVQTHCSVETPAFAADIEGKALRGAFPGHG